MFSSHSLGVGLTLPKGQKGFTDNFDIIFGCQTIVFSLSSKLPNDFRLISTDDSRKSLQILLFSLKLVFPIKKMKKTFQLLYFSFQFDSL